jgi:hypothetical protein
MRRTVVNSLLLLLFIATSILPYVSAGSQSKLRACCRREGKHHCAMGMGAESSSGPTLQATGQKCTFYARFTIAALLLLPDPNLSRRAL